MITRLLSCLASGFVTVWTMPYWLLIVAYLEDINYRLCLWVEVGLTDVPKHMCVHPLAHTCKRHSDHICVLFFPYRREGSLVTYVDIQDWI